MIISGRGRGRARIDLHAHSAVSDGTDPPEVLVRAAAGAGLDVLALTDHDTMAGVPAAAAEAARVGLRLVPGMEVSTRCAGASVHLLAYFADPAHGPLARELERLRAGRAARVPRIVAALRAAGLPLTEEDVRAAAGSAQSLGRPHVADALVRRGLVADRDEAFARWLGAGRPGAVPKPEPATADAVALVRAAGGVPVVAHPWSRVSARVLGPDGLAALAAAGVVGLEVDHPDHTAEQRMQLRGLATDLGLVATGSSDSHGAGKAGHALGECTTAPDQWRALLDRAAEVAAAAGRGGPAAAGGRSVRT